MRLVELRSDQPSFRTVKFNRSGLSFVIGEKKASDVSARNRTKTYNGVGKSLMLELLHFCLGTSFNEVFAKYIPGWTFYLTVEVDGREHVIARRTTRGENELLLDGKKHSVTQLRAWLLDAAFEVPAGLKGLTFRSLISPFVRSGRAAYERCEYTDAGDRMSPYYALIRNAFLLGLDLHLAQNKFAARSRWTSLKKTMKQLESEPLFAELLSGDRAGIELANLRDEEKALDADLKAFRVAKNYEAMQAEADTLKRQYEGLRRESVKVAEAIAQIDRSLTSGGDIDPARVRQVYDEAKIALPEQVSRRIDEVVAFQKELQSRRVFRLTSDRQNLAKEQVKIEAELRSLSSEIEGALQYLGTHVALDEYLAVSGELNDLRAKIAKLEASEEQREKVTKELLRIERDLADQSVETGLYLESAKPLVSEADGLFRQFARALYGPRTSGLQVSNDTNDNTLRYQIQPHIKSDAAEGINEAKIFCYDLMMLSLGRGHNVEFLVHDSSLFSPVDHRQRFYMLKLAEEMSKELGIQYIATLNEHDITSMKPTDEAEIAVFDRIFSPKNVVLRLTDQTPKERLLGIEVDMDYARKPKASAKSGADE